MEQMNEPGSGESLSSIPLGIRTQLVNMEITIDEAAALVNLFRLANRLKSPISIEFAKEGKRTYGTAWYPERRIRLNRKCVGTLIHETAHILCPGKGHGYQFAKQLDSLYIIYLNYLKVKEERPNVY